VCASVGKPVNVLMGLQGASFSVAELAALGVRRISVGSALSRAALGGFLRAAREIREQGTFGFAERPSPSPRSTTSWPGPEEGHGKMDGFSAGAARALFARRPEWERHATEEPGARPGSLDLCLWVRIPGLPEDDEHEFVLATYDGEITVSLGPAHVHLGEYETPEGAVERLLDQALSLADDLLSERLVAVTWRMRFIGLAAVGFFDTPEEAKDGRFMRVIKVRSWKGTYDRHP